MKKIFLLTMLMVASLGMKAETTDAISAKVSGTELDIALTNSVDYVAFQMDITLPSGVSASSIAAVADRLTQTGDDNTIGSGKFIVASNVIDATNNIVRVIAYNLNNDAIAGTSGDNILKITLSETVSPSSSITVSNITFVTESDLTEVTLDNATGEDGYQMGDVNHDFKVNILDAIAVVKYVLYGCNAETYKTNTGLEFYAAQANINSDDSVNVLDAVAIAREALK